MLRECLSQLEFTKHRKNADMETYLRNNMVLLEIEKSLTEIKELIDRKIERLKT